MNVSTSHLSVTLRYGKHPATKAARRGSSKAVIPFATRAPLQIQSNPFSLHSGSTDTSQPLTTSSSHDPLAASDFGGAYGYDDVGGIGSLSAGALDADRDVAHLTGNASAVIPGSDITEGQFLRLSPEEQRKQRRLIRNRLSAHMHRQRQRGHIDAMETQVTELSFVVNEMRERLQAARNALARVAAELPSSSTSAMEAAVAADAVIFAPGVMKYQPPREPGLLGFTGPTKDALNAIRNAVSTGLVGVGVKPMCMALTGGGGERIDAICTQMPSIISKPSECGVFTSQQSSIPPSNSPYPLIPSTNKYSVPSLPLGPSTQINLSNRRDNFNEPQVKTDPSLRSTFKFVDASINSPPLDDDLGYEGSESPHSSSIPTDSSSPDTLEIGASGKRTKKEANRDRTSDKKSKPRGQSRGIHKKVKISRSASGGGGSSSNTTATTSSSSSEDEMNPPANLPRSTSALSTSSVGMLEAPLSHPLSTLSSSLIDFLPHKPAPIPLLLEEGVDDNNDDEEQESMKRSDDVINNVFNGVKAPSEYFPTKNGPLPRLSFSRMSSFEVSSSSPLGGEEGFVATEKGPDPKAAQATVAGGLSSPSPFVSLVRAGPFMRMTSFEPPSSAGQHAPLTFVEKPMGASEVSSAAFVAPRTLSPTAVHAFTHAISSSSIPKTNPTGSVVLSSTSSFALGTIALLGLIAVLTSNSTQSAHNQSYPPGVLSYSSSFSSSVVSSFESWKRPVSSSLAAGDIERHSSPFGRLLLSDEMRNALGFRGAHIQNEENTALHRPPFLALESDDSILSRHAMLVLASASADFDKIAFGSSSNVMQTYSWPYSLLWSKVQGKNILYNDDKNEKSFTASKPVKREDSDNNVSLVDSLNDTLHVVRSTLPSRASLRASTSKNNMDVSSSVLSMPHVDLSSIAAAGRALGRSMAQMVATRKMTESFSDHDSLSHIGRVTSSSSVTKNSATTDKEGEDVASPAKVLERELKVALQTYAEAARQAYIRTQRRLSEQSTYTESSEQSDNNGAEIYNESDSDGDSSSAVSSASVVLCPDAFGSMKGLSTINHHSKRSRIISDDQTPLDNLPPVVGSNILPLPPPVTDNVDDENSFSYSKSSPEVISSSSPPYLLLLVPSDSIAGRGVVSTVLETSNFEDSSGHVKVELQGSSNNVSTVSASSVGLKTTTKPPQTSSSGTEASFETDSREGSSGWIEVGCEVVSLRKISRVPVTT